MIKPSVLIQTQFGDINGDGYPEKVMLKGTRLQEDSPYFESLEIVIIKKDKAIQAYKINEAGYNFHLILCPLLQNQRSQIVVIGDSGGSGNYAVLNIYNYENYNFKQILNSQNLANQMQCVGAYLNHYQANITCLQTTNQFTVPLNTHNLQHLNLVYDDEGCVLPNHTPIISVPNTIYPIIQSDKHHYSLQIQQRIIGPANADTLGAMQSIIDVNINGEITYVQQELLMFANGQSQ